MTTEDRTTASDRVRCLVLHPEFRSSPARSQAENWGAAKDKSALTRSQERRLEEACGLALAIDLDIIDAFIVPATNPRPSTLLGSGKVEEIASQIRAQDIELIIFDGPLSPVQQRNLERAWKAKVLDRTALILEIFGERARTKEGRLQVDLAHLTYQRSRLVRSWTHLERQRGGVGFLGGPGETQIEADRRVLLEKITKLKRELETVQRTRKLHRSARKRVPYPIVALVGYTNAGKSTLFNRLTDADVFAEDLLFATLDPTMRLLELPTGQKVILSDTVGFISNLPTQLIAAFRATLEEVLEADVIVHVRDISEPDTEIQKQDVEEILRDLLSASEREERAPCVELLNKMDLLEASEQEIIENSLDRSTAFPAEINLVPSGAGLDIVYEKSLTISAIEGTGIEAFLTLLSDLISDEREEVDVALPASAGEQLAWIHQHAEVLTSQTEEDGRLLLTIRIGCADRGRYEKRFGMLN